MSMRGVFDDLMLPGSAYFPEQQYTAITQASGTLPVAAIVGATNNVMSQSGATALTLPTAAAIYAQLLQALASVLPVPQANIVNGLFNGGALNWTVTFINTNGGTLTLSAGTGITLTGTATLATSTTRTYVVTLTSPSTATFQNIGSGSL